MFLLPFFEWLDRTQMGDALRNSVPLYTTVEIIHLLGVALLVGTILIVDVGLMGVGMRRQPISQIAKGLAPFTWAGFAVMAVTGPLLLSSQALKCYDSRVFWVKIALLLSALVFHFTLHRTATAEDSRMNGKIAGAVSLLLWTATAAAAKWVEFA